MHLPLTIFDLFYNHQILSQHIRLRCNPRYKLIVCRFHSNPCRKIYACFMCFSMDCKSVFPVYKAKEHTFPIPTFTSNSFATFQSFNCLSKIHNIISFLFSSGIQSDVFLLLFLLQQFHCIFQCCRQRNTHQSGIFQNGNHLIAQECNAHACTHIGRSQNDIQPSCNQHQQQNDALLCKSFPPHFTGQFSLRRFSGSSYHQACDIIHANKNQQRCQCGIPSTK